VSRERRAAGLLVLAACGYGSLSIGTALADRLGVTLAALMAWRYTLAAPVLLVAGGGIAAHRVPWRRAGALLLLGGGGQTLITWLSLSALAWLSAASLGFLFYTYPAWVALFAALAGTERLTPPRLVALALALVGITVMVGAPWSAAMPWPGVVRALGAAVVYALYIPLIHRLRGPLDAAVASTYVVAGAAIVFVAAALGAGTLWQGMGAGAWAIALVLAVVSTAVAFIAFLRGLEVLGPVRTAILSTVEPFWTALLAAIVLGQAVGPGVAVGGVLIIAAILLLQHAGSPAVSPVPAPD
jgi:drug/metabolite transporter (DMT)-like permease